MSPSGNYVWTTTGIYTDTVTNVAGCDSVITVDLKVNNTDTTLFVSTCDGAYVSPSGNYTWTSPGIYNDTIPNSLSCDSIITVNLDFPSYFEVSISEIVCGSYTSPSGNYTWTNSGVYQDTLINPNGCDTAYTINLTVAFLNVDVTQVDDTILIADNAQATSYQWLDCNDNFAPIPEAEDSAYHAFENGSYAVIISLNGCTDTSLCYTIDSFEEPIGFEEVGADEIYAYPNPTTGLITLDLGSTYQNYQVKVVNVYGQEVYKQSFQNTDQANFEIEGENGLYFVQVIDAGEIIRVLKVVKQ